MPCATPPSRCFPCFVLPTANASSEGPDHEDFVGTSFTSQTPEIDPGFNWIWSRNGCVAQCVSTISQEDADQCAARQQLACSIDDSMNGGGGRIEQFCNAQQSCTVTCADGSPFVFTEPAGVFCSTSQTTADAQAFSFACSKANQHKLCLSDLSPNSGVILTKYSGQITATGKFVGPANSWSVISGSLPPGMTMPSIAGPTITISGTPASAGTFNFLVQITLSNGDFMQKGYTITVTGTVCPMPSLKSWTNAAFTGLTFDISANGNFLDDMRLVSAQNKVWVIPAASNNTWFVDTYDITSPTPVSPGHAFPVDDGAFPQAVKEIYVSGPNKMVMVRQHFNGASYDLWLSFVSGLTGNESSHQVGLTTEANNNIFASVDRSGTSPADQIGWLTANNTFHKLYTINVDAETVIGSVNLPGNCTGLCYSCVTDSFFTIHGNDLIEYDRATLVLKNTYVGLATGMYQMEYIKSTQEIWAFPLSQFPNLNIKVIDPTNGTLKTTIITGDAFPGWVHNVLNGYSRFYHETLNAVCVPGPTNLIGDPVFYYFYDVSTHLLKKKLDITALLTPFNFNQFFCQEFNLSKGSVYLCVTEDLAAGNRGIIEIGTT